jgi:hypothetical protein
MQMQPAKRPEHLTLARFTQPSTIQVKFHDGLSFELDIKLLKMPVNRISWQTAAASPAGEAMTVKGIKGDTITIDSSTVRYLVDPAYAAKLDESVKALRFTRAELAALARDHQPPDEWYDQPARDYTRESWK